MILVAEDENTDDGSHSQLHQMQIVREERPQAALVQHRHVRTHGPGAHGFIGPRDHRRPTGKARCGEGTGGGPFLSLCAGVQDGE